MQRDGEGMIEQVCEHVSMDISWAAVLRIVVDSTGGYAWRLSRSRMSVCMHVCVHSGHLMHLCERLSAAIVCTKMALLLPGCKSPGWLAEHASTPLAVDVYLAG